MMHIYSKTPFERPTPLEKPHYDVNVNIKVQMFTPDETPSC